MGFLKDIFSLIAYFLGVPAEDIESNHDDWVPVVDRDDEHPLDVAWENPVEHLDRCFDLDDFYPTERAWRKSTNGQD